VTVFIKSGGALDAVYQAINAAARAMGEIRAEMVLLDDGSCDEAPLLPLVVRHLRYARLSGAGPVAGCNAAMRLAGGDIAFFLSAGAQPVGGWADALAAFEARPAELRGRWSDLRAPVDAVTAPLFAVRLTAWRELHGLDENFTSLDAALVEFCLRLNQAGHGVGYEPGFGVVMAAGTAKQTLELDAGQEDAMRLREAIGSFRTAAE
jgi:hypothetical protein